MVLSVNKGRLTESKCDPETVAAAAKSRPKEVGRPEVFIMPETMVLGGKRP
jgi:hypothetical protein